MIHFAGPPIRIDNLLRQRCAWCGVVLFDYNLSLTMSRDGSGPTPWLQGTLVKKDGPVSSVVHVDDHGKIPAGTCADIRDHRRDGGASMSLLFHVLTRNSWQFRNNGTCIRDSKRKQAGAIYAIICCHGYVWDEGAEFVDGACRTCVLRECGNGR